LEGRFVVAAVLTGSAEALTAASYHQLTRKAASDPCEMMILPFAAHISRLNPIIFGWEKTGSHGAGKAWSK